MLFLGSTRILPSRLLNFSAATVFFRPSPFVRNRRSNGLVFAQQSPSTLPSDQLRMSLSATPQKRKMVKLGTHSGSFHCDEALGCFLLKQLPEYKERKNTIELYRMIYMSSHTLTR